MFYLSLKDGILLTVYEYPQDKRAELVPLFEGHKYLEALVFGTLLTDLGKVFVDDLENPKNVVLLFGNMVAFGGLGEGEVAKELVLKMPNKVGIVYPNDKWKELIIAHFGDKLIFKPRTKFSSANLDIEHIRKLKKRIPDGYEIVKIDEDTIDKFEESLKVKINRFCGSMERFRKNGFGFCVIKDGKIVADATTGGLLYENAFELDIETHPDHRRKGLATVVGAALIEYSLENGYDPRWDAANKSSADLALKMGYTDPEDYDVMIYWVD